jgi:pectin methylesterase-like acyl-CoA thioesterase
MSPALILSLIICEALGATDLYVGYNGKPNNYRTVQQAVNRAAQINPRRESERVSIHVHPGTYREQVIIKTPYVTLVNHEPVNGEAIITWYYGIGYKYYSCNAQGIYDANLAKSKSSKRIASKWGATVQVYPQAKYFQARNIVFENSFNRYMTREEISDGVQVAGDKNASPINVNRKSGLDVQTRSATERAAAITIEAPYSEFYGCKFYSSQDTVYTGASPQYFRKCVIEGQTDYIFGVNNAVFDNCELRWKGYSGTSYAGYITAARAGTQPYTGYLFKNCRVTKNTKLNVVPGYFGRPWGNTAKVMFINTVLKDSKTIAPEGWYEMSGVKPENVAGFKESGTKLSNGQSDNLSKRKGIRVSDSDARTINVKNYMNGWNPSYLNI